jgi:F-type H+-transporting ATPase subunit b
MRRSIAVFALLVPSTALASGAEGFPTANWTELGSQTLNFVIYLAVLVALAKKPVTAFFKGRREEVAGAIESAEAATSAAEARLAETMKKLDDFDAERETVLAEFRELGEAERRKIVADAESAASKIVRDAEQAAERELAQARESLRTQLVSTALTKAQALLTARMTSVTQAQLIDDGIDALSRSTN